jgi:hypothetical protein
MGFDVRRRTIGVAAGATTLLASGALAAQSSAAQIALDASCYLNTDRSHGVDDGPLHDRRRRLQRQRRRLREADHLLLRRLPTR